MWGFLENWISQEGKGDYTAVGFDFDLPIGNLAGFGLILIVLVGSILFWRRSLSKLSIGRRIFLVGMRTLGLILLLFLALDPCIIGRRLEPGKNYVLLLFDDSLSMNVSDREGTTRADRFKEAYQDGAEAFEERLKQTHQVVAYKFGRTADRIQSYLDLSFSQTESNIRGAIETVKNEMRGTTLSSIVVFTDGVEQPIPEDPLGDLETPVYTVGVGQETAWRDLEISRVSVARTHFDKSPVSLTAHLSSQGMKGTEARVEVLQGKNIVASKPIVIAEDLENHKVRLDFVPQEEGWIGYSVQARLDKAGSVESVPRKDRIAENDVRRFLIDNRKNVRRILYFSGRPNWQNKFVRKALEDDPELEMASLIRISGAEKEFVFRGRKSSLTNPLFEGFAEGGLLAPRYDESVFIRQGLKENELAKGYPLEAEDLFPFDLVIWGDIEADFFTQRHMELTKEFVSKRGGTLLLMGGERSFASGNYAGTPIENMAPVMLKRISQQETDNVEEFIRFKPTAEGFLSGTLMLDPDPDVDRALWRRLPNLFGANEFPLTRTAASVLATVGDESPNMAGAPLLVWQRYGEGKCAILATGETWQWAMETDPKDPSHHRLWRQIIRGLVAEVDDPVVLSIPKEDPTVGKEVSLQYRVRDNLFEERPGLVIELTLAPPGDLPQQLPVEESIDEVGVYDSSFEADRPGVYRLVLSALDSEGKVVAEQEEAILVNPDHREFQNAQFDSGFLKEISDRSGGEYFPLEDYTTLLKRIQAEEEENTLFERFHLWHYSPFYFLLVLLLSIEWYFRRRYGQA